jgi:hypothetical protein
MNSNTRKSWTEKEDRIILDNGCDLTGEELSAFLPERTVLAIRRRRFVLGVKRSPELVDRIWDKARKSLDYNIFGDLDKNLSLDSLDYRTRKILIGCLIGDTSVRKSGSCINYMLSFGHGPKQLEYLKWKRDIFSIFEPSKISNLPEGFGFNTKTSPMFTKFRNLLYDPTKFGKRGGKSYLPDCIIDEIDIISLLIWYLDDGHKENSYRIASTNYSFCQFNNASISINTKFLMETYISRKTNPNNKVLCFPAKDRDKIRPIWEKCFKVLGLPTCMEYKL